VSTNASHILIYDPNPESRSIAVNLLLLQNFLPKSVDSLAYAVPELASGRYGIFLCSCGPTDASTIHLLQQLRTNATLRHIIPVVWLENPQQEFVLSLVQSGCTAFILKNAPVATFLEKIDGVARSLGSIREKRQHVRIDIPEYENAQLMLTTGGGRKYSVRVTNISIGGLQFTFGSDRPYQRVAVGDTLTNSLLVIKSLDMFVDLKIMSVLERGIGTKFMGLNETRLNQLCKFVYDRIQSDNLIAM
jgi:CheY-like chemotaxis protein